MKHWQKRFIVLRCGHLQYFETQEKAADMKLNAGKKGPKSAKGNVSVANASVDEVPTSEFGKEFVFDLKPFQSQRRYLFKADSAELRTQWINELLAQGAARPAQRKGTLKELKADPFSERIQNVRHAGILLRRETTLNVTIWKERYFSLKDSFLMFHEKEDPHNSPRNAKGVISLSGSSCFRIDQAKYARDWVFGISPYLTTKIYCLCAPDEDNYFIWLAMLAQAGCREIKSGFSADLEQDEVSEGVESVKQVRFNFEGVLIKLGEVRKTWQTRYFVLKKGQLMYYVDQFTVTKPKGILSVYGGIVQILDPAIYGRDNVFGFYPTNNSKRMYIMSASTPSSMHDWILALATNGAINRDKAKDARLQTLPTAARLLQEKGGAEEEDEEAALNAMLAQENEGLRAGKDVIAAIKACSPDDTEMKSVMEILVGIVMTANEVTRRNSDGVAIKKKIGPKSVLGDVPILVLALLAIQDAEQQAEILNLLLARGAFVDAKAGHIEHLWYDADENGKHTYKFTDVTPLHVALVLDADQLGATGVSILLDAGANPNYLAGHVSRDGVAADLVPPITICLLVGSARWLGQMAQSGGDVSLTSKQITERFTQMTRRGAGLYKNNKWEGVAALHLAISKKDLNVIAFLMRLNADADQIVQFVSMDQTFPGPKISVELANVSAVTMASSLPECGEVRATLGRGRTMQLISTEVKKCVALNSSSIYRIAEYATDLEEVVNDPVVVSAGGGAESEVDPLDAFMV